MCHNVCLYVTILQCCSGESMLFSHSCLSWNILSRNSFCNYFCSCFRLFFLIYCLTSFASRELLHGCMHATQVISNSPIDRAGIQVIGNSVIDQPWQKIATGCKKFEQIVSQHRHKSASTELKKDLISMLSDSSRYRIISCWLNCTHIYVIKAVRTSESEIK